MTWEERHRQAEKDREERFLETVSTIRDIISHHRLPKGLAKRLPPGFKIAETRPGYFTATVEGWSIGYVFHIEVRKQHTSVVYGRPHSVGFNSLDPSKPDPSWSSDKALHFKTRARTIRKVDEKDRLVTAFEYWILDICDIYAVKLKLDKEEANKAEQVEKRHQEILETVNGELPPQYRLVHAGRFGYRLSHEGQPISGVVVKDMGRCVTVEIEHTDLAKVSETIRDVFGIVKPKIEPPKGCEAPDWWYRKKS